jgi:hypothetical protein
VIALAQVAYLAAAERVLAVRAAPDFDKAALATMLDVADRIDDFVECLGLVLIAAGVAIVTATTPRRWHRVTDSGFLWATALLIATILIRSPHTDITLVATGLLAIPIWTPRLSP